MKKVNFTAERIAGFAHLSTTSKVNQTFYWDAKTPGLGLRVTSSGSKSYIFETRLHGKTMRMTIGDTRTWAIGKAQQEATRLKAMTDQGIDPRQVLSDSVAAQAAEAKAKQSLKVRESVTLGMVWSEYLTARAPKWSARHLLDHQRVMKAGGEKRQRSAKLTQPGELASFSSLRLVDLTPERIAAWAEIEARTRPTRARLALRLLKACLFWCSRHPIYKSIIATNAAQSTDARETLGKPAKKNDALQREQLSAWFAAVKQINNPVISVYLQSLLLTGARRNELGSLRWKDVDFKWGSLTINDKVDDLRVIPLTPYVAQLLANLPRRNEWVFSSPSSASGRLAEPSIAHHKACATAGVHLTLHGLRRSFASLCEWIEVPAGIAAQIQGHAPQGVREQNYIRRPLDLLRMWHIKIEVWILEQAGIEFVPVNSGLSVVA